MTTREVVLDGGSPWGFRLHGGADINQPLRISRVNPGSKAALRGIREGDYITSINGQSTKDVSNAEAHALLKNSGDTLRLGLNEDYNGSPKRRQYKTVHQETHSETVKRSSVTSYTLTTSKTISQSELSDKETTKYNENNTVNGHTKNEPPDNPPEISQRSTLSSNYSSASSTPSTHPEGADNTTTDLEQSTENQSIEMSDNISNSRSRRKRSRNNRKKTKNPNPTLNKIVAITETVECSDKSDMNEEDAPKSIEENSKIIDETINNYRVESPKPRKEISPKTMPHKSKSLDDDEMIKIQELSEVSETDEKSENKAIVSEVESDIEWDMAKEISNIEENKPNIDIKLDSVDCGEIRTMSPEEELTLRNFLEGLNLVNSPEDAVKQIYEKNTVENLNLSKAKKRAALEQYFLPIVQNPRFLDVISEETSDISDREQQSGKSHLKQSTPELDLPPPIPKENKRKSKLSKRMQSHFQAPISNPAVLVETKLIEPPTSTHSIKSGNIEAPIITDAEIVYLDNSSNSTTPDPKSDNEEICEKNEEPSSNESSIYESSKETLEEKHETVITVKKNDIIQSKIKTVSVTKDNENKIKSIDILSQLTPPPTPDDISVKNEVTESNLDKNINLVQITNELPDKEVEGLTQIPNILISTNAILPSPSPSASSGSSRATSLCTTKYNPMNSSIADITSISKDEEFLKTKPNAPLPTLRELCINYLILQPFGVDILQELAEVSLSIEKLTNNLSQNNLDSNILSYISINKLEATDNNFDVPVTNSNNKFLKEDWSGLPTENNPTLLVYLSPTQKAELEKTEKTSDEAGKLLDLHEKFIFRTTCSGTEKQTEKPVEITSIKDESNNVNNRLLEIIRNDDNFSSYTTEKISNLNATLSRTQTDTDEINGARLKAKDLNEWLQLARGGTWCEYTENNWLQETESINNMHRRTSLPTNFYEQQMQHLLEKEREIQRELERLEEEKRKLSAEMAPSRQFQPDDYHISRKGDYAENRSKPRPISMPISTEIFRQQMYEEYMDKVAAREERKQLKVIKVTSTKDSNTISETKIPAIEDEFMDKVKEKQKMGKLETKREDSTDIEKNGEEELEPVLVMDGGALKGVSQLPKHLQEFVDITKHAAAENNTETLTDGVWSPGQKQEEFKFQEIPKTTKNETKDEQISPIWTPKSATSSPTVERKEFRPVKFDSPVLSRKNYTKSEEFINPDHLSKQPPWKTPETSSEQGVHLATTLQKRLPTSHSSPASGFNDFSTSRLPKVQNPTITLLQKAREGQLPKGASYIEQDTNYKRIYHERPPLLNPGEIRYQIKNEYTSESDSERPRKMADLGPRQFEGIGPTTKDGMPLILRSEIKDANQSKWYKKMYDTIHKQRPHRDEYVTVRYKQRRGQYPYSSGYLSEPEPGAYDSDFTDYSKYATLDRRRLPNKDKENEFTLSSTMPRTTETKFTSSEAIKHDPYKNQPGRIEHYTPGRSSISDKEAKEWWDEVMDIFDGHLEQQKHLPPPKSFINQALKESGYESDSTLVFRRRDDTAQQLSPQEQKEVYKVIQKGGDIPLHGLRKPAPEKPKAAEPEMEFFPISPTLTRIHIHKRTVTPQKEIICYPVTVHPHPSTIFANYKRTAPSSTPNTIPKPPPFPPSPPRRRSSRNNTTLRLISTMKVKTEKSPLCKRHETCFTTTSNINNTNVKYLRDKISCKLSPNLKSKESKPKIKVSKTITTSPEMKSKIISTISSSKDTRTSINRIHSRTNIITPRTIEKCTCKPQNRRCKKCLKKTSDDSLKLRTFGTEKKKVDLVLPKQTKTSTLINSPDLMSPTEVKKASGIIFKKSNAILSSVKQGNNSLSKEASIPIKVGITERGKAVLRSSIEKSKSHKASSPNLRSSLESLRSPTTKTIISTIGRAYSAPSTPKASRTKTKTNTITLTGTKKLRKSKKEQINGEIAKKEKEVKVRELSFKKSQCAGRATGKEIVKKLKELEEEEFGSNSTLSDIQKQKDLVKTDYFFQHLFLRNTPSPSPSISNRYSWLLERAERQQYRRTSISEPTIGAMKVYLKHTKPVTDSKFKSLDLALVRSRSASPKSVTWEPHIEKRSSSLPPKLIFSQTSRPVSPKVERKFIRTPTPPQSPQIKQKTISKLVFSQTSRPVSPRVERKYGKSPTPPLSPKFTEKRSSSLPPKIFFSETSRPVSPIVERRFIQTPTPPHSPKLLRSPSSRRIMAYKSKEIPKMDLSLYSCHNISQSSSSLDSYEQNEYQNYVQDFIKSSRKSNKFKDLNEFYTAIEKFGQLEQATSSINLKPRRKHEEEIIDYDRWQEVRTREKAEKELKSLTIQLKEDSKQKGFLFCPKEVDKYRWKRELDRGLRVKEKSVEDIKEQFENIKQEESILKRELRDIYKPLWRGDSVIGLAHKMVERRSQSEGRVASAKQKLIESERMLTHGIGSRLWSSLSMEQVNILKNQLSEIYSQNMSKHKTDIDYSIQVPPKKNFHSNLTVRRNSDLSEYSCKTDNSLCMSESDKKVLSQTLSKEALSRVIAKRKPDIALPLILAKETRGAIAAADALDSLSKSSSCEYLNKEAKTNNNQNSEPKKPLVKTNAVNTKINSTSETESGSTDESTRTVIFVGDKDIKKKVEYFETAAEKEKYTPTIYKPADDNDATSNKNENGLIKTSLSASQSCQNLKELFGERELMKFATVPLAATRQPSYQPQRPKLRVTRLRTPSPPISETTSFDSFQRSRSLSPPIEQLTLLKAGEVHRLKRHFEYTSGTYPPRLVFRPRRWCSDPSLNKKFNFPGLSFGDINTLKSKYEYAVHVGRGRSRIRRGGVVSPTFLRAEDRLMPHINIISKIADLYSRKSPLTDKSKSMEELAQILGCPIGEVEKMRIKFDQNISLLGHMFTSSPNIKELKDIAPYLAASWIAHKYPRYEDNTRSLSSPETSLGFRDTSLIRKDRPRSKSTSPSPKAPSILKTERHFLDASSRNLRKLPINRYQPEPVRYKSCWTSTHSRPSVSFKEPEPPVPPPKGQHGVSHPEAESPRKYVENEVTIHYKTPVRHEIKEYLSEDELAYRQAEAMKKIYQEERRRKYLQVSKSLQELQDMNNRRHTDNFIPSQKSPIPLNRYDDFNDLTPTVKPRPRSPERRLMAKALYNFVGQTARELTFRKGDLIYVRRQVDKNWYEGELNAMVGLFPVNYVEIVTYDPSKSTPRKSHEGQARAKFNFVAQTHLELSLAKGELVIVTRRVDDNWFEGKIGGRKGIFPVSYVDVLIDPSDPPLPSTKPVASPAAHSLLLNGSAGGKESMGSHSYTPSISTSQLTTSYHAKPVQITSSGSYGSLNRPSKNPLNQALHIETQSEPIPYRAMYKYLPQNDDELELLEGDTVYVLEKCDDGWYVGSSERTGAFGTFPGNYVEKI